MMSHSHTNALINETSPYLLQHAHNPVDWHAWSTEILKEAETKNKLLLISIGYAACHWCHVMEHECFEDHAVAEVMNTHFINVKIDREERPDIDHIYMDALQMMTGSGGWPLNIVALPDGRPFWGATYVKKENWIKILNQLAHLYKEDPAKILEYAQNMADGIQAINLIEKKSDSTLLTREEIDTAITNWSSYFDTDMGGYNRAPKFMMPVNLNLLLHYAWVKPNRRLLEYVNTSLTKIAWGGVFDHIGGGFSRYSVDMKWHIPHFEKMLYDNGQMVSLYAKAYALTKRELYKEVVIQSVDFVKNELMNQQHGFYSSLDADSLSESGKLEEGAYYVWKEHDLKILLKDRFVIFKDYFNINSYGYWEHDNYVLIRNASKESIAEKHSITVNELVGIIDKCTTILQGERLKRKRPRLDDKILTSWNGLMLEGLTDAYRYLKDENFLDLALKNGHFIVQNLLQAEGGLYHNHNDGKSTINAYLEDYASVISAFIGLYEVSFDEDWLFRAQRLVDYCLDKFLDIDSGMFFFTSKDDDFIIRRTIEVTDNVIPASNSIMAKNLFKLSRFFPESNYEAIATQQLKNVRENITNNAQSYANWLQLGLFNQYPFYEIAVVGDAFQKRGGVLGAHYLPNAILAASEKNGNLSLFKDRYSEEKTSIFVCQKGACKLPVTQTDEVLNQLIKP
ncbi:thioredoxin domain-containing protein [Pareuzebyella sediminis]|uniref:thioredoxin domain-containing protein n=1 Tax=Pareuzebyella sediminis TaxID=2607998 RepID=UPI002939292E|nr:thioredoxin domain-containing protein [Pareuzebyella sediminis]